jgi:hypothetical protein
MPARVHTSVRLADLRRFVAENEPGPHSDLHLAWTALRNLTLYGPEGERERVTLSAEWELPREKAEREAAEGGER